MKKLALAAAAMAALLAIAPEIPPAQAETTLCTEITSLPFTITVQGVYCLKQNLNVNLSADGSAAILINTGNVTIDFNGFRINNQAPLATNRANGVLAEGRKNITIRNGFVRGFFIGIYLEEVAFNSSASHLVEDMKVADSGNAGIVVEGDQSVIRNNRVIASGGGPVSNSFGIVLQRSDDGQISGNIISGVTETADSYGFYVFFLNRVLISNNEITNVNGGSNQDRAIVFYDVSNAVVAGNRLLNGPVNGTGGIVEVGGSTNIACLDNEIGGFTATPMTGCDFSDGNRILFN